MKFHWLKTPKFYKGVKDPGNYRSASPLHGKIMEQILQENILWYIGWMITHKKLCQRLEFQVDTSNKLVPWRVVLKPELFNILVKNMDSGIEGTISKFADNTKPCVAVNTLEGRQILVGNKSDIFKEKSETQAPE